MSSVALGTPPFLVSNHNLMHRVGTDRTDVHFGTGASSPDLRNIDRIYMSSVALGTPPFHRSDSIGWAKPINRRRQFWAAALLAAVVTAFSYPSAAIQEWERDDGEVYF
jgi:hypothetical protein